MSNDIKELLDSIIDNTNNSYPDKKHCCGDSHDCCTVTFDKGQFREKLSMFVLKDIICAMMHDETKDLDSMIDESIMQHIHDNYNGSYYGYLMNSRDKLNSPILSDIIQELDDKTNEVAHIISNKKDTDVAEKTNINDVLKNVDNYDELRAKLKDRVTQKVIDDVAGVAVTSNDAPVFDKLDEKLTKTDTNDVTEESVILRMTGSIVTESAIAGNRMSTEEGINRAIVQYCLNEMDFLFKQTPKVSVYAKYL